MNHRLRSAALEKLAFYGPAFVVGAPVYRPPEPTVGQFMYNVNAMDSMSSAMRRNINDQIVNTGINVNSPAKNLLKSGIGALAGNFLATAMNMGPFARGLATAAGASMGYNYK